jgi:hypothetical protein
MDRLNLIALLETQITQEINRLKQNGLINKEQEKKKLAIYTGLIKAL